MYTGFNRRKNTKGNRGWKQEHLYAAKDANDKETVVNYTHRIEFQDRPLLRSFLTIACVVTRPRKYIRKQKQHMVMRRTGNGSLRRRSTTDEAPFIRIRSTTSGIVTLSTCPTFFRPLCQETITR